MFFRFAKIPALAVFLTSMSGFAESNRQHRYDDLQGDVVRSRVYPKAGAFEFSLLDVGGIINQTYIMTIALHGDITYFFNERWGISLEFMHAFNSDKDDRRCLETFYNDDKDSPLLDTSCQYASQTPDADIQILADNNQGDNFGPVYPEIREIDEIIDLVMVYTPTYGKEILLTFGTIHFDTFFTFGGGLAFSTYYPEKLTYIDPNTGEPHFYRPPKGYAYPKEGDGIPNCREDIPGICPKQPNYENFIGIAGRPASEQEQSPTLVFGVGQKFHFRKRFHLTAEIKDYMIFTENSGLDNYIVAWAGLGVRF